MSLSIAGGWNQMVVQTPSNPYLSVIVGGGMDLMVKPFSGCNKRGHAVSCFNCQGMFCLDQGAKLNDRNCLFRGEMVLLSWEKRHERVESLRGDPISKRR